MAAKIPAYPHHHPKNGLATPKTSHPPTIPKNDTHVFYLMIKERTLAGLGTSPHFERLSSEKQRIKKN